MDGIASLAASAFATTQGFRDPDSGYRYHGVQISVFAGDGYPGSGEDSKRPRPEVSQLECDIPAPELLAWFDGAESTPSGTPPEASLKAVQINRNTDVSLDISRECFDQLFTSMRADPAVKYVICHDYDGFHEFAAPGYLTTRFIGTGVYAILWTFDPLRVATRALFIRRRREPFGLFTDVLRAFQGHVYTPWLLGFVSSYLLLQWSDRETSGFELPLLRHVEVKTGFGPHPSGLRGLQAADVEGKFDINVLTSWSQAVNEVAGNIGNKVRHQRISRTVLAMIVEAAGSLGTDGAVPTTVAGKQMRSLQELSRAVPPVENQLATYLDFLIYLKDRADKLSSVLFALLTHEDAAASINIATATKADSSSMKTVAVMTMAFLPATFFAALFAVPSLKWDDRAAVIQHNFWIYWAFTLPCTAMVFVVWYLITQQNWILGCLRRACNGEE